MTARPLLLWISLVLLGTNAVPRAWCAATQSDVTDTGSHPPLRYREVLAPANRQDEWPMGDVPYMPMDPDAFKKNIAIVNTASRAPRASIVATIISSRYRARLVEDVLVDGQARLDIGHSADGWVMLPLDPCGLAIGNANWADKDGEPAKLGSAVHDRLEVQVEQAGQLEFNWSLRGRRDAVGAVDFHLQLPPCPAIRLVLDLPEGMTPVPDEGIVVRAAPAKDGIRQWWIELGGHHRFALRVVPAEQSEQQPHSPRLRQSLVYEFSQQGVDVSAQLQLDVLNEPLRQIDLVLDPELRLVAAEYNGLSVPWSVVSPPAEGQPTRVVLELLEPIRETGPDGPKLLLRAWAPLKLDCPWRLPRIRPEGMFWQETNASLRVPRPLLVEQLVPVSSRQSGISPLGSGELIKLQYFAPDAGAEIVLTRFEAPLQLDCGTAIKLSGGEITARVVADFHVAGPERVETKGERFELVAHVARRWIIDSVESDPPQAMGDWSIGKQKTGERKLTIRLAKALSRSRPVRLLVTGRRLRSPVGRSHRIEDLKPLRFAVPAGGKRLMAIHAAEPYQLIPTGTEGLKRVDPQTLAASELALFRESPRGLVFEDDAGAADLRVSLEPRKPSYSATIRVEATASGNTLVESYELRCVPQATRVERVLVRFSQPRDVPPRWILGRGDEARPIDEASSADGQAEASQEPRGQTWEIRLRPTRSEPFEIRASRTTELTKETPVSLVSLPEAASQRATLAVGSTGSAAIRVKNKRLKSLPAETTPTDPYNTAQATYRYEPMRHAAPGSAALVLSPHPSQETPPTAWVWSCRIESRYEAKGTGQHLATYRLQNAGRDRLQLALPPTARLDEVQGVWIDDKRAVWQAVSGGAKNRLTVELPPRRQFPVVSIHFTTNGRPLERVNSITPPLPEADVPVLSQLWTVWLPPGYEAFPSDRRSGLRRSGRLTGIERVLGPLAHAANHTPFDPFQPDDWSRMMRSLTADDSAARKAGWLLQQLAEIAAAGGSGREISGLDWGTLLVDDSIEDVLAETWNDQAELALLVDQRALSQVGLTPRTPVKTASSGSPTARGVAMLQQVNLTLLVHDRAILLTSATDAAGYRAHLTPIKGEMFSRILPGPLADQVDRVLAGQTDRSFVPVAAWGEQPTDFKTPWTASRLAGYQPVDTLGWTACRLEISGDAPARLTVVHRKMILCCRWIAFLVVAGLAWWKLRYRPAILTALLGLFGIAALLVPEMYVPVFSGAFLGTLCGLGLMLICPSRKRADRTSDFSRVPRSQLVTRLATPVGILVLALATILVVCVSARGADAAPKLPPAHLIFIPVDENEQPTGEKYQVPEEFYQELIRRTAEVKGRPQGWLLSTATYRGVFSWQATPERLVLSELRATFTLEVFGSPVHARIPLGLAGADLLLDSVKLDGRVIQADWQEEDGILEFDVPEKGSCRLELLLQPTMLTDGPLWGFDLTIPRLATSRLELAIPSDAPKIEVPTAAGSITHYEDSSRLVAELGPSDRLSVRWRDSAGRGFTGSTMDVEELLWMKVLRGSVVLDARFKFRVGEGTLGQFLLTVDPWLQRLGPFQSDAGPITEVAVPGPPGQPQAIRLELEQPVSGREVVVRASFHLKETSGVGNLHLPHLETRRARVTKRWMAVSVDPTWEYEQEASEKLEAVAVPVFAAAWGETESQPLFAYSLASGEPAWSMPTRPRQPETTVDQKLALSFARKGALVQFDADLVTTGGYLFQHRILAPPALELDNGSVSVLKGDTQCALRSCRATDGTIIVFLDEPVEGEHKLSFRGRLPIAGQGTIPLPSVRIEGARQKASGIHLYRQPSVKVEVSQTAELVEVGAPAVQQGEAELGRLVKGFRVDTDKPVKASVTISPNRPTVRADQITSLRRDGESWRATADFRLTIKGGAVDELRLEVPLQWNGPYEVDPPAGIEPPDENRRLLVIRPHSAIEGDYRLIVSSPLTLAPGDAVSVPQIVLQSVDLQKHFLVLPTQSQLDPVAWDTHGLRATELPDDFPAPPVARESFVAYRVEGRSFRALLRPLSGVPQVHLADVNLAWGADKTCYGVVVFDLETAGLSECTLRLPTGCRLVHVAVSGVPTTPVPSGDHGWRIPLGSRTFPQRIGVVFEGTLPGPDAGGLRRFEAPTLATLDRLPVRQTLWTVAGPSFLEPGQPANSVSAAHLEHELVRLRNTAGLIELVKDVTAEEPRETIGWYRVWLRRWVVARHEVKRQLALVSRTEQEIQADAVEAELDSLDAQQRRLADLLGASELLNQVLAETPTTGDPAKLWLRTLDRPESTTRYIWQEGSGTITLKCRPAEIDRVSHRVFSAAGLGGLTLLAVVASGLGIFSTLFRRWPHALGVVAGLAWWLWLSPAILGLLIVVVSLVASFRSAWKRHRHASSVIVPLSLTNH